MFRKVSVYDLKYNVFEEFEKNWMLLSAKNNDGKVNTMTVSWGSLGNFWGREAATVYVRQSRYTKEFIDNGEYFTLSLFDGKKKELGILGSKSGRDGDKIAEAGFSVVEVEQQPAFEESKCVLICKKMYVDEMSLDKISAQEIEKWYSEGNPHTMYIGEIVACYINE
ncbi:MAG: flavin reductase [Lachnospiraceae bacterium]|nr:flavin reductase [Lachnospiraceae bacterium]